MCRKSQAKPILTRKFKRIRKEFENVLKLILIITRTIVTKTLQIILYTANTSLQFGKEIIQF